MPPQQVMLSPFQPQKSDAMRGTCSAAGDSSFRIARRFPIIEGSSDGSGSSGSGFFFFLNGILVLPRQC